MAPSLELDAGCPNMAPQGRREVVRIPMSQARKLNVNDQRSLNQTVKQSAHNKLFGSNRSAGRNKGPMTLGGVQRALSGQSGVQANTLKPSQHKAGAKDYQTAPEVTPAREDLDGKISLCPECRLPMGEFGYYNEDGVLIHGECMAQSMLQDIMKNEKARQQKEVDLKNQRRQEYNIGWKAEHIPSNVGPAKKLGCELVPESLCCLNVDEVASTVSVMPTMEPAAAVNLEYLSTALQVRRTEGREPYFSLDPVDPNHEAVDKDSMQVKHFEPEWLAGTSVGEVLFQSDYHLKELSMGEYDQPVVGMKSCFEFSAEHKDEDTYWSAREWFMVRDAKIHMSEDNVLIPEVRMGVEAREQECIDGVMFDKPITRATSPMVLYADAFTRNFDLIAERKSAVYHLRDLAKASILAKHLIDNAYQLNQEWFVGAEAAQDCCSLEVPQLWNERLYSKIQMKDGEILDGRKGIDMSVHGVYGGVDLGLSKFPASQKAPPRNMAKVLGLVGRKPLMAGRPSMTGARLSAAQTQAALSGRTPSSMIAGSSVQGIQPVKPVAPIVTPMRAMASLSAAVMGPQGVDLNLDNFNLSTAEKLSSEDVQEELFSEKDQELLDDIFNPHLCDRRDEGDRFVLPDSRLSYVSKLRKLVDEEKAVREQRKEHFCSKKFAVDDAGLLFPQSWKSFLEIKRSENTLSSAPESLHERSDAVCLRRAMQIIKEMKPMFDKCTEDGMRFRIYRVGSVEVRTTQEHNADEVVGVVYSIRPEAEGRLKPKGSIRGSERVVKVTEYVERTGEQSSTDCSYYVVLETENGSVIVTEKIASNMATWEENSIDVDDRNSLAKVIRSGETKAGITVQDVKSERQKAISTLVAIGAGAVREGRNNRLYAQDLFIYAMGGMEHVQQAWAVRKQEMDLA